MKKITHYVGFILAMLIFVACQDEFEITDPVFDIQDYTVDAIEAGNGTSAYRVKFNFHESADIISFYSGENGSEYKYRDGKFVNLESLDFSFTSRCGYGEQEPLSQFSVVASPDFSGEYTMENVHQATWIDITDRFDFTNLTAENTDYNPSGMANLYDLLDTHGQLYLAFKYVTPNQFENGVYAAIRLRDWEVFSETDLFGVEEVELGWGLLEYGNLRAGRNSISSSTIILRGNHGDFDSTDEEVIAWLEAETEAWVISQKFTKTTDLGADSSSPIKAFGDPQMHSFVHEYSEPGEYEVVFFATNANIEGQKGLVKKMTITIP